MNLYVSQKKYADAETALRKLLAADPQNTTAHVQLGRVLAAEGKNEEAARNCKSDCRAIPAIPMPRWSWERST